MEVEGRGGFGDGKVVVQVYPQGVQIGNLGGRVVGFELLEPSGVKYPAWVPRQCAGEQLGKQIVFKIIDSAALGLGKTVFQCGGGLKPGLPGFL